MSIENAMTVSLSGTKKNYIETEKFLINHFMDCSSSRTWVKIVHCVVTSLILYVYLLLSYFVINSTKNGTSIIAKIWGFSIPILGLASFLFMFYSLFCGNHNSRIVFCVLIILDSLILIPVSLGFTLIGLGYALITFLLVQWYDDTQYSQITLGA